jgi:hypothetical protein
MDLKAGFLIKNKSLIAFILITLFWSSFLFFTGTITSGFHFTDDHEIITIQKKIYDTDLISALKSVLREDMAMRFRPFYYIYRIVLIELFGTNILAWSILNFILAILTSYLLFLFVFRQGYSFINALLFPLLTLVGSQTAIWWRLGPAETIGFVLLSISLFLLNNAVRNGKKYQMILSIICLVLSSLSKESFLILIPAYILILLWLKWKYENYISIYKLFIDNVYTIVILIIILLVFGYLVIFLIGTNKIGYAGIDDSVSIGRYLSFIVSNLRFNKYTKLIIIGLFFLLQNIESVNCRLKKAFKDLPLIFNSLILMAIIIPQYLIYSKSGIFERYFLPLNLGFSLFVIFLSERIFRSKVISEFTKRIYIFLVILVIFYFLKNDAIPTAKVFADEGKNTNKFLSTIIANTRTNDSILVVLNGYKNYEWGFSIRYYLRLVANRPNIKFLTIDMNLNDDFERSTNKRFLNAFDSLIVKDLNNDYSCIAVLPFNTNQIVKNRLDSNYYYQKKDFKDFTVYNRRVISNDLSN